MINWLERLTGQTQSRLMQLLRRSARSITSLAATLGLTDNAVRTHINALSQQGIVERAGVERETGGKPARLYSLTREGEELFPKAYALVLGTLVETIVRTEGPERAKTLLHRAGQQLGAGAAQTADPATRVAAAAKVFGDLGAEVELQSVDAGWELRGYGCPLSSVSAGHPEVCGLAQALIAEITGLAVEECCQREGQPRCGFRIAAA